MFDVNRVILLGRLGADPIVRETKNGTPVVHFPMATSKRSKQSDSDSEWKEDTQWHRVVSWGKQGLSCAQYLRKGQVVFVEGTLQTKRFEAKDGTEKMLVEVQADRVSFVSPSTTTAKSSEQDLQQ